MKRCSTCNDIKPLTEFYKRPTRKCGLTSLCIPCISAQKKIFRSKNKKKIAQIAKKYRSENKAAVRARYDAWATKNPEKVKAYHKKSIAKNKEKNKHKATARAAITQKLRSGKRKRGPCEVCGEAKVHAHHDDYSKPLDVRWLCHKHHVEHHNNERAKNADRP